MRRPLKYDKISKFYLKLLSSFVRKNVWRFCHFFVDFSEDMNFNCRSFKIIFRLRLAHKLVNVCCCCQLFCFYKLKKSISNTEVHRLMVVRHMSGSRKTIVSESIVWQAGIWQASGRQLTSWQLSYDCLTTMYFRAAKWTSWF